MRSIVGARKILIAYNINLNSSDLNLAKSIAKRIRASGGGFPFVKALGLPLGSRGLVQVAMNLTDFEQTFGARSIFGGSAAGRRARRRN